jgi:hypothetical protein
MDTKQIEKKIDELNAQIKELKSALGSDNDADKKCSHVEINDEAIIKLIESIFNEAPDKDWPDVYETVEDYLLLEDFDFNSAIESAVNGKTLELIEDLEKKIHKRIDYAASHKETTKKIVESDEFNTNVITAITISKAMTIVRAYFDTLKSIAKK